MPYDQHTTIEAFLNAAAAKQPAPGGGSIAALAGALAATMGEMVLNYSVDKKNLAEHQPQLVAALAKLNKARFILVELMVEDQSAYQALNDAKKLPEDSPERSQVPALAQTCVDVPLSIAATAVAMLDLAGDVAAIVNPYLLSDLAVCADLAMATVRCATYNVAVNLPELASEADRSKAGSAAQALLSHATASVKRASSAIWSKPG
ncbi:hypothetical protein BH10PLA1_BH10PLA1_12580 [soil metagenome]